MSPMSATALPPAARISSTTASAGSAIGALADQGAAEVVDDDPRALRREAVRLGPTDAATAPGDDGHLALE